MMQRPTLRLLASAALLGALAAGWGYLYSNSRAVNTDRQNVTLGLLKDLKQIDTDWGADVLRSQADIIKSYDPLVRPLHAIADVIQRLEGDPTVHQDASLMEAVQSIRAAVARKSDYIDRFKAQNALLKNSLNYLPTARRDIENGMGNAGDSTAPAAVPVATPKNAAFVPVRWEEAVPLLVNDTLRYYSVPDIGVYDTLRGEVQRVRLSLPGYSAEVREPVGNLLLHVETILKLRSRQNDLLRDIASVPVQASVDDLAQRLTTRFDVALKEQASNSRLLLLYSAMSLALVFGAAGWIAYRNATERRRLAVLLERQTKVLKENEAQLIHAQKMNALGEMVAGITHEVNTPLAAVRSGLQSTRELMGVISETLQKDAELAQAVAAADGNRAEPLAQRLRSSVEAHQELASVDAVALVGQLVDGGIRSVDHISGVITNMLNFSRLDRSRIAPARLEEGLESTLAMAAHFLSGVSVEKQFGDTRPVTCDIAQINQVLLNLVRNAAQALPESGGRIQLRTRMASPTLVEVSVADNGSGIPPDVLPRIWEPFFTTKKQGAGTGLGLSTSRKIVAAHGGTLKVVSTSPAGSTFTMVLPVTPPAELQQRQAAAGATAS
ncbi:ATP-binding protein [Aquabacterium sp. A7-Y]|uniref:DAHL domain-containing protein n=1 Tax=Aquabacterium sp. A7-Y TaxID=1349605 RepID=UPI00223C9666|nr:DAHL domain-containing protein [Aquabacterium sp. A7-Y]MCW7541066.1 ATP-binding protein [Aquabacterium sp. A7-Y]